MGDDSVAVARSNSTTVHATRGGAMPNVTPWLWFDTEGHLAVVGGTHKVVAYRSPISTLMLPSGKPSGIEIRWAFNQGDLLP